MNTTLVKFKDVNMYGLFMLAYDAEIIYEKISLSKAKNTNLLDEEILELFAEKRVYLINEDVSSPSYHSITVSHVAALRKIPVIRFVGIWVLVMALVWLIGEFCL